MGAAKAYSSDVPVFLWNRPKRFVRHCMQRLHQVDLYGNCIKHRCSGVFSVECGNVAHAVSISSPFPCCDCLDWRRSGMPCKHMLAVVTCADGMSWESLPESYRQFPMFTLDDNVDGSQCTDSNVTLEYDETFDLLQEQNEAIVHQLEPAVHSCSDERHDECAGKESETNAAVLRLQSQCRQLLNTVSNYTYKIEDFSLLEAVIADMKRTLTVCKSHIRQTSLTCFHTDRRRKIPKTRCAVSYLYRRLKLTRSKRKRRRIINKYRRSAS
jgi:hypothetical protein